MGDPGLFSAEPYTASTTTGEPVERISAGRRLTIRQADAVHRGVHPLALVRPTIRLHPDADPKHTATAENADSRPLRCGTCRWRDQVSRSANTYPKCMWRPASDQPNEQGRHRSDPPRYSAGQATDVRGWWPGCTDWQPREEA